MCPQHSGILAKASEIIAFQVSHAKLYSCISGRGVTQNYQVEIREWKINHWYFGSVSSTAIRVPYMINSGSFAVVSLQNTHR